MIAAKVGHLKHTGGKPGFGFRDLGKSRSQFDVRFVMQSLRILAPVGGRLSLCRTPSLARISEPAFLSAFFRSYERFFQRFVFVDYAPSRIGTRRGQNSNLDKQIGGLEI